MSQSQPQQEPANEQDQKSGERELTGAEQELQERRRREEAEETITRGPEGDLRRQSGEQNG